MGAPLGNKNAAKGKRWASALEGAMERHATGKPAPTDVSDFVRGINAAAEAFVAELFANKDLAYFKEFGDRMDGKSSQSSEVSVEHHGGLTHEHLGLPETARWLEEVTGTRPEPLPH